MSLQFLLSLRAAVPVVDTVAVFGGDSNTDDAYTTPGITAHYPELVKNDIPTITKINSGFSSSTFLWWHGRVWYYLGGLWTNKGQSNVQPFYDENKRKIVFITLGTNPSYPATGYESEDRFSMLKILCQSINKVMNCEIVVVTPHNPAGTTFMSGYANDVKTRIAELTPFGVVAHYHYTDFPDQIDEYKTSTAVNFDDSGTHWNDAGHVLLKDLIYKPALQARLALASPQATQPTNPQISGTGSAKVFTCTVTAGSNCFYSYNNGKTKFPCTVSGTTATAPIGDRKLAAGEVCIGIYETNGGIGQVFTRASKLTYNTAPAISSMTEEIVPATDARITYTGANWKQYGNTKYSDSYDGENHTNPGVSFEFSFTKGFRFEVDASDLGGSRVGATYRILIDGVEHAILPDFGTDGNGEMMIYYLSGDTATHTAKFEKWNKEEGWVDSGLIVKQVKLYS